MSQVDKRVARTREKVMATTFELLHAGGIGGVSIDEIARRSGVAKTTIYRHWPTREALVLDACAQIPDGQATPDTGTLAGDATAILTTIGELLARANWAGILPSIVDVAERDEHFAAVHRRIQQGHAAPLRAVVARAAARGELPDGADPDALVAALLGALFYRRWFAREPTDAAFVADLVATVLRG
jgi:AcrR family transcriptional regulator